MDDKDDELLLSDCYQLTHLHTHSVGPALLYEYFPSPSLSLAVKHHSLDDVDEVFLAAHSRGHFSIQTCCKYIYF